jgi:hypothetical protein
MRQCVLIAASPEEELKSTNYETCARANDDEQAKDDDDVFHLFLQKQIGAELNISLEQDTYHKRLFRGSSTNKQHHLHDIKT